MKKSVQQVWIHIAVMATGFILLAWIFHFVWLAYLAGVVLFLSLLSQKVGAGIVAGWMKFASIIGFVNSRIILTIVFYFILTPIALVYRIFAKRDFDKYPRAANSSWKKRQHQYTVAELKKMW